MKRKYSIRARSWDYAGCKHRTWRLLEKERINGEIAFIFYCEKCRVFSIKFPDEDYESFLLKAKRDIDIWRKEQTKKQRVIEL